MTEQRRETSGENPFTVISNINQVVRKPIELVFKGQPHLYPILALGLALVLAFGWHSAGSAQDGVAHIGLVRAFELDETGLSNPAGLAFSAKAQAFHVVEGRGAGQPLPAVTNIVALTPFAERTGTARIAAQVKDPINMAFDNRFNRLLILQSPANRLIEVLLGPEGDLDPKRLIRRDVRSFGLQNPQGMTVDPASGHVFILDTVGPRIVRVEPGRDGSFTNAVISAVNLQPTGLMDVRGLAYDPTTGHLHLINLAEGRLYELTQAGKVVARRDLANLEDFRLANPQGMVFAPSGDLTDDPLEMSLYLADGGRGEIALLGNSGVVTPQGSGQVVEFSFAAPVTLAATNAEGTLIQTIDTSQFSPPSPDPSGIAYPPASGTLLISDGEVDEMPPYFTGDNLFEASLSGSLLNPLTVISFSDEPVGLDVNPVNRHLFISDDTGQKRVYELDPGPDGQYNTADDSVTSFSTSAFGSNDPEGVAFDPTGLGTLFIADGINREVYRVTPGANGLFDGVDDQVTHFDTLSLGWDDPEGIAFNPVSGTLYAVGKPASTLFELTTGGSLVRTIDISVANARKPAGLALGPSSVNPAEMSIYIAARGVDNDVDPNENDGKVYEIALGIPAGTSPEAVDDGFATAEDTTLNVGVPGVLGNDSDQDGDPLTAIKLSDPQHGALNLNNDGSFTYIPAPDFFGSDSFTYQANDGALDSDIASVSLTIAPINDPPVAAADSFSTAEDTPLAIDAPGVLVNDSDAEGDPLITRLVQGPDQGTFNLGLDGSFIYTPIANFNGEISFVYKANDGQDDSNLATVSVTVSPVNDPPRAEDQTLTTEQGIPKAIVLAASDAENDPLTFSVIDEPRHGILSGAAPNMRNVKLAGYHGPDSFTFRVNDGSADSNLATVDITVIADSLPSPIYLPIVFH